MSKPGHYLWSMGDPTACNIEEPLAEPAGADRTMRAKRKVDAALIAELVNTHHRFIWRLLGRLGVPEADLDDATQQAFMVLTQRADLEIWVGSERAFLFGIALKVARTQKRTRARRRESSAAPPELASAPDVSPEALTEQQRARRLLDDILESMPMDLRLPFVLFEIEDLGTAEIAVMLNLPTGTVASRLRRAREWFDRRVLQFQSHQRHSRGGQ